MAFFHPQFQILSDLRLETPKGLPSYAKFKLHFAASHLFLLGDIGLVKDAGLFGFFERLLQSTPNIKIYYVFGIHEAYQMSIILARDQMRDFDFPMGLLYGKRFFFLHRTRVDISDIITVLGCTLWTKITTEIWGDAENLTDFDAELSIRDWDLSHHMNEHNEDLTWLNEQVLQIARDEPQRQIIILTHHSPTVDPRAIDPAHLSSGITSGFANDLSKQLCWTSNAVKMWAFGRTHYSCAFVDEGSRKIVIANQRGCSVLGKEAPAVEVVLVEARPKGWEILSPRPDERSYARMSKRASDLDGEKEVEDTLAKSPGVFGSLRELFKE